MIKYMDFLMEKFSEKNKEENLQESSMGKLSKI
jgi:hypothetical protein